ncbi:MAG: hypothetical protein K2H61_06730 [Muribaculaceae bacterium]|nr:hypothetical protein [Muribaculaceae bacterium]MDE7393861.1 hypothetical protein [Muribaculaceae bacterium]
MKTAGIILLVIGILNLLVALVAVDHGADDAASMKFGAAFMFIAGGIVFLAIAGSRKNNNTKNDGSDNSQK